MVVLVVWASWSAALLFSAMLPATEPEVSERASVPALMVVPPVKEFAPERVRVPVPFFVRPFVFVLSMAPKVTDWPLVSKTMAEALFLIRVP